MGQVSCFPNTATTSTPGESTHILTIQLMVDDNSDLTGQQVHVVDRSTEVDMYTLEYKGQPLCVSLPHNFRFYVYCSDKSNYRTPTPVTGEMDYSKTIIMKYLQTSRLGYRRDKNNSNPQTRIEYLFDAVGMNPMHVETAGTGEVVWGDWKNFVYEVATPVMLNYDGTEAYELDPDNQAYKKDGTASDISNASFQGNAMVRFNDRWKWVKRYQDDQYEYVIFSDTQYDETYHAYAHTDLNGNIRDRFYWGMFKGSYSDGKLRSLADKTIMVNTTRNTEVARAQATGEGYTTIFKSGWDYICDILTLISKSDDSQTAFGTGRCDANNTSAIATGTTKNHGPFWGVNNQTSDVKTLWIEGFWGNVWEGMAGLVYMSNNVKVKMTPPYNFDGTGYYSTGNSITGTSGGFISKASVTDETGFIPTTVSGSATTYYCDGCWFSNGSMYALVSGLWDNSLRGGDRCVYLYNAVGGAYVNVGSRLSYTPIAE